MAPKSSGGVQGVDHNHGAIGTIQTSGSRKGGGSAVCAFEPSIPAHRPNRRIEPPVSLYLTSLCPRVHRAAGATATTTPRAVGGTGISTSKQPAKQLPLLAASGRANQKRFAAAAAPVASPLNRRRVGHSLLGGARGSQSLRSNRSGVRSAPFPAGAICASLA